MQVFKAYVESKIWDSFRSKHGITDSFRAKVKHVAGDAFVDVLGPKVFAKGSDQECISALTKGR